MALPYHKQSVFATKSYLVSASRVRLQAWSVVNIAAMAQSVLCYNANAIVDVTIGTTVPDWIISVPANATAALGAGNNLVLEDPLVFAKGLVIAFVEGVLDTSATAAADATLNANLALGD